MENIRKPQILIQTDGITNTKIFIDGKELPGVAGVRFSQSYKENKGLPVLQIELKATLYIQNRSVLLKTQEKAFDKVVKIL